MAEPTYRMSFLPFGTYANPDGTESLGLAVPGMIQEPINALMRLAENSRFPDGRLGIPNPDNAQNREDVLTGLLSMYGGNAMNPGRLMKGAAAKAAPEAAREAPYAMYRGAPNADGLFPTDRPLFMSSSPEVAGTYAGMVPDGPGVGSVSPAQANFVNPMVVDAQGRAWNDIPFNGNWIDSNALTYWARDAGHDGLVIKNVTDHLGAPGSVAPADTVVALKRGTVSSPLTGETLYSDTGKPSLFGSAIAGARDNLQARYRDWRYPDEAVARSYNQIAKDKPTETLGDFDLRRSATSNRGGMKYDLFNGSDPIASLMIDAPRRLSPTPFDMATASSFEKLERAQPLAGTITRIEVNEGHKGKGIASSLLDVAENDLKSAGAILHPGDTSMTQDFMNLYAKRDPEMMRDAFARMGVGNFDDQALMFNRALRSRASRKSDTPNLTLYSDNLPSIWGNALAPYQDEPRNALLNY